MATFEQGHDGHPDGPRPQIGDGRMGVLAQARRIGGRAVGEMFADLADGSVVVVVLRQDADGVVRVEVTNQQGPAPVDVFINGKRVHEPLPF